MIDGLLDVELKSRIIVEKKPTFGLASQYAIEVDNRLKTKYANASSEKSEKKPTCKFCNKKGHLIDDCRLKNSGAKPKTSNESETKKCDICNKTNHPTEKCYKNPKNRRENEKKDDREQSKKKTVNIINKKSETSEEEESSDTDGQNTETFQSNTIRIKDSYESQNWYDDLNC